MFATALFDLDGTLVDPRVGIVACFRHALAELDVPTVDDAALEALIGPPLQEGFRSLGVPEDLLTATIARYRDRYAPVGLYEAFVHEGIAELLEALAAAGVELAVATSKPAVYAERLLEHFGLRAYFRVVCGPALDGRGRHKHEVIAEALAACGPGPAVMIGDREHDVLGARVCALDTVGVTWGFGSRDELVAAGAWRVVDVAEEVRAAVLEW